MKQHGFQRIADIAGDSGRDSALLREMAVEAKEYITSFRWCPPLDAMYFAHGVGGIVAIFLAEFSQEIGGADILALILPIFRATPKAKRGLPGRRPGRSPVSS